MRQLAIAAFVTVVAFTATAGMAQAQILNTYLCNVDNSSGGAALDGFVTTDFYIDFEGQYNATQMLLDLPSQIYQDAVGSDFPPNPALIDFFPSLEFDTFVAQGSSVDDGNSPNIYGGAADLGGAPGAIISDSMINAAWGPGGGVVITDQVGFLVARLTLADTANGVLYFFGSAGSGPFTPLQISFFNGHLGSEECIPEPSGDFDEDSDVDGADFLYWQRNDGSESNLDLWQATFGEVANPITAASTAVPEPSTLLLLLLGLSAIGVRRFRK
jgi:hypothetical protein